MKSFTTKVTALFLIICLILCAVPLYATAEVIEDNSVFIYLTNDDINASGFYYAVQGALNQARDSATSENRYTVVVPEGTYYPDRVLRIYSNTTLRLDNVTLIRSGSGAGNMLRVGDEDSVNTGVTGYAYENARVIGGTFDGNMGENTIIKAFHTRNFTMEEVTLLNEKEGHMTEFAGVDGLTIRGCVFQGQFLTPGNYGYEAIQLDVLHPFHITNGRCEDLPVSNVLIENCSFDNMPRAIGSHTAVHNNPHNNITIRNNSFTNLSSIAIQGMNWTNVDIHSNAIENAPRGITIYAEPGGCTYLSSKLAAKGSTQSHVSDSYQTPPKANINITNNVLVNIGTTDDKYASYSSQGIAVLGEKLTAKSPVKSDDESGGLPAGDYYIDGVIIHANFIDIRGNGVRIEDARNVRVSSNEIVCSKNTVHSDNYYGVVLRSNVTASTVSYNTIMNAEVNGIQLDGTKGGSVTTVQYNQITGSGKYGISAYTMTLGNVYNNDIIGTKNIGLFLGEKTKATNVKFNRIRYCSAQGIWITSNSSASLVEGNTTVGCTGTNSYGGSSTIKTNYTSSKTLTGYKLPWNLETERKGAKMGVGTMFKFIPAVSPSNAFASFTYKSSDEDTVMVDANGMVYALKEGTATITVRSDNGISKSYVITVEGDGGITHLESVPTAPVLILGDADGNSLVESADVTFLQRRLAYMETPISDVTLTHGDVDGNENVDLLDVTYIQLYLAEQDVPYPIGEPI